MKILILLLTFSFAFIGCGKDNSSGGNTSNGVESEKMYLSLASSSIRAAQAGPEYLNDNLGVFRVELLDNKTFRLFREGRRGLIGILNGSWSVSGTNIILNRMGTGSYLQSTTNGVVSDCILMNNQSLGTVVLDELRMTQVDANSMLKFCKLR